MGTRWIRKASDTPSVSNIDDVRMIRYAYGYQDGILKNVGAQASASTSGSTFKIGAGVIVLQGWELEIDANGWSMTVDNVATKRYYAVYYEINLAVGTAEIKSVYSTSGTPSVNVGADLSAQTTGTASLLLYTFSAQNGAISSVVRTAELVQPWTAEGFAKKSDLTSGAIVVKTATNATNATRASYASADTSKGTIEERLTNLGFKSGVVAMFNSAITPTTNFVRRQGNYVYGRVVCNNMSVGPSSGGTLFTLPSNFRPKSEVSCSIAFFYITGTGKVPLVVSGRIETNGKLIVSFSFPSGFIRLIDFDLLFGFEATAIT